MKEAPLAEQDPEVVWDSPARSIIKPNANVSIIDDDMSNKKKDKLKKAQAKLEQGAAVNGKMVGKGYGRSGLGKYKHPAQTIIPYRSKPKEGKLLPLETVGCYSYLTQSWMTSRMIKAFKSGLGYPDLFEMPFRDQAKFNSDRLQHYWRQEMQSAEQSGRDPSFIKAVWRFARTRLLISSLFMALSVFLQFLGPSVMLKLLLDYLNSPVDSTPTSVGWTLVFTLLLTQLLRNITFALNFIVGIHTALRVSGATQYLGFSKLLRLEAPSDAAFGQLVTFCTGDQERINEAIIAGVLLVATPILFAASIAFTIHLVGPMALIGLFIILMFYPIMGVVAAITSKLRQNVVKVTDQRVSQMNEVINAIRLIKMYAWEAPFLKRIQELRARETNELRKTAFVQSISSSITPAITIIAAIATFVAMTSANFPLTAPEAFTLFSVFASLQFTAGTLPYALKCLAEGRVALNRLQTFLMMPEYVPDEHVKHFDAKESAFAVKLVDACLAWPLLKKTEDKASKTKEEDVELIKAPEYVEKLHNLNLEVANGELIGVAGPVGAGKSSLISTLMGEMKLVSGEVQVGGKLALVSQQAWIFNASIRENILFGSEYQEKLFKEVVKACCLEPDLEALPDGDKTEVGERGVNLSGGQKQRVNMARALYANYDIYLLDDPLSAVDTKVARSIFQNAILTFLRGKTIFLISHGVQFLEKCDRIVFMKEGRFVEIDSHVNLMANSNGQYFHMVSFDQSQQQQEEGDNSAGAEREASGPGSNLRKESLHPGRDETSDQIKDFTTNEEEPHQVGASVLLKYLKACGGYFVMFLLFLVVVLFALSRLFTAIWLEIWLDKGDGLESERRHNQSIHGHGLNLTETELKGYVTDNPDLWFYQLVLFLTLVVMIIFGLIKSFSLAIQFLKGSSKLHDKMLLRIMQSPMVFFDKTPAGRILNRFSKDMDEIDVRVPFFTEFVTQSTLFCLTQILVVCCVYPWFTLPFAIIISAFVALDFIMNRGVLETRKLENTTKSPVLHHLSSAMAGVTTIRGYQRQHVFQRRFNMDLNSYLAAHAMFSYSNRWFVFRMDFLALLTILLTAVLAVAAKGMVSAAVAGLALVNVFQCCIFVPFVMRMKTDLRARFNSVERVCEYANDLDQEEDDKSKAAGLVPASWPNKGQITFEKASFRYRPSFPLVLKDISLEVEAGTKVGIVGRTGAGKTSLVSTLLRLAELDQGVIKIDDLDISQIGLSTLRSAVAVIPQDPTLFQGTIRYNLDPFERYSDDQVWAALEKAHLKDKISGVSQQLSMSVEAEGDNFSVGEKQLICLARALLRKNKILLLDEATASVDVKTDFLIQTTIKEAFSDCTVLTVAHRLHTVLNYDKILVLHKGEAVEYDSPQQLLKKSNGVFRSMMDSAKATTQSS